MIQFLEKSRRFLWLLVETLFVVLLTVILIGLFLGPDSGSFVQSVLRNVTSFAGGLSANSLIGLAIVLALFHLIRKRVE